MNPKKPKDIIELMSEPDKNLVNDLVSFYFKDVRKALSEAQATNIIVEGLGTFRAKSWKLPDIIAETEKMRDKYKAVVDNQNPITFQKFAILKDYEDKLEKLYALRDKLELDKQKKEQMKHLKEIWKHRKQILEGVGNAIFKKEKIEAIANSRMEICKACPIIDLTGEKCVVPGTQPCCGACGCKLAFKTRSLSSQCEHPDGPKWEAVLEQAEEDKLYQEINYNPDEHGGDITGNTEV